MWCKFVYILQIYVSGHEAAETGETLILQPEENHPHVSTSRKRARYLLIFIDEAVPFAPWREEKVSF